ncbi:MAG: bifunctional alpha,alpha-trehalose-phosphate synthase (UDP-forming)/trehalose-phosphatase [Bacteroidaceae bacterium]
MKLYIISNRLPVKIARDASGNLLFLESEGGLVTGLNSLHTEVERHWIGWPGMHVSSKKERSIVTDKLHEKNFHPVFLSNNQIDTFYKGYCNSILWPLFHYFFSFMEYENNYWDSYKEVNQLFLSAAAQLIEPGDIVWVQDYHLMLLPKMLRTTVPSISIGYFHHVPFPSYDLFRVLPKRAELLHGLLGADLVGFHTFDYKSHFISTVERVLHLNFTNNYLQLEGRKMCAAYFPMGINYEKYHAAFEKAAVTNVHKAPSSNHEKSKTILSVDRLDYSKGIIHRVKAFGNFLKHHPEYRTKIALLMVIVPSRDNVYRYAYLKKEINEAISAINGAYSTRTWTPICYFYHSLSFEYLVTLYREADIALITPLCDGMNLVAKEYIAAKRNTPGVLILSEMAGASIELNEALLINPNDLQQIEQSIVEALSMPVEEQFRRLHVMQAIVKKQDIKKWAFDFLSTQQRIYLENKKN